MSNGSVQMPVIHSPTSPFTKIDWAPRLRQRMVSQFNEAEHACVGKKEKNIQCYTHQTYAQFPLATATNADIRKNEINTAITAHIPQVAWTGDSCAV